MDSAERSQTTDSPNHEGHSQQGPRRSQRLKGLPLPVYNPEHNPELLTSTEATSDKTMLSTPALPHLAVVSGEPQSSGNDAIKSRKRKAATSAAAPPPTKKPNIDSPTPTRQRKAVGNPKYKTVKERFQAASAEDKRPLPWGEPDVWAEVWFPCKCKSTVKAKQKLDSPRTL